MPGWAGRTDFCKRGGMAVPRSALSVLLLLTLLLTACTGEEARDPEAVLEAAADRLDAAESAAVRVGGTDLPDTGTVLVSAEGVVERPDAFAGTLQVRAAGLSVDTDVLSVDGQFYARLPFTDELTAADPAELGFGDPGALLARGGGIDRFFAEATAVTGAGSERRDGEVVDVVEAEVPGDLVAELLVSADPSAPVAARFVVTREGDELRQVDLTGPFYDADLATTYSVVISDYDAPVEIPTPPDGG